MAGPRIRKKLTQEVTLVSIGLPILVLILVQQAGSRRVGRLIRKLTTRFGPYRDRVITELAELDRQITWDEVVDWVLQVGARGS